VYKLKPFQIDTEEAKQNCALTNNKIPETNCVKCREKYQPSLTCGKPTNLSLKRKMARIVNSIEYFY